VKAKTHLAAGKQAGTASGGQTNKAIMNMYYVAAP
jgi:hypothetical protein